MEKLKLLTPLSNIELTFKNRVFMAPMTRGRSKDQIANELTATYYAQRATAGLIFTEGTQISAQAVGWTNTPGIYTPEQIAGWKKVTRAVHDAGGLIFAQLWHTGRASHPDFHGGELPVAPSAVPFNSQAFTPEGIKPSVTPREMTLDEINATIAAYEKAAQAAKDAGFDGVEVHGANGYLPAQFLEDGSNKRTDEYGGTVEKRARFLLEATDAAIKVFGSARVSVRLSPRIPYNDMGDSDLEQTYMYAVDALEKKNVGILHFMESAALPEGAKPLAPGARKRFSGIFVLNVGYDRESAEQVLESGLADAVTFGTLFISNPDLPERFRQGAPLTIPDASKYYSGAEEGYTDYPLMA
ncbi:alkene reductase [Pseudomonas sp. MAFF 302030]|uniref:Alkene reductase n=1 Tax=Pseudomonas morbosilactucae TaxID=2938197 RepID=A0A9X1YQ33_9PSED|nr:alkene reductase [Pseudomonas morbosilactucae]MCK9796468.1 alkene reductase [Pseudomonas morbosilactucae]